MMMIEEKGPIRRYTIECELYDPDGRREITLAMKAGDMAIALSTIRETFARLWNDGMTDEDVAFGDRALKVVLEVMDDYELREIID